MPKKTNHITIVRRKGADMLTTPGITPIPSSTTPLVTHNTLILSTTITITNSIISMQTSRQRTRPRYNKPPVLWMCCASF